MSVAACGEVVSVATIDGAQQIDATVLNGKFDYVFSKISFPETTAQAAALARDLDGNGTAENRFGNGTAMMAMTGGTLSTNVQAGIDNGLATNLLNVTIPANALDSTTARIQNAIVAEIAPAPCVGTGVNEMCGLHLKGNGQFIVDADRRMTLIEGPFDGTTFRGETTRLTIDLVFSRTPQVRGLPFTLSLENAKMEFTDLTVQGIAKGVIAGAMSPATLENTLKPQLADYFNTYLKTRCTPSLLPPGCECIGFPEAMNLLTAVDTSPSNCAISPAEVTQNAGQLFEPDVTINGVRMTSFAFGFTAVKASFAGN
jgi:hypothetical protein